MCEGQWEDLMRNVWEPNMELKQIKGGEDELYLNINSEHGYCERMETNYDRNGEMLCRAVIKVLQVAFWK